MTLRELLAMAEGRRQDTWSMTSAVMALLANCHRDPRKSRPFSPRDFDPFAKPARPIKADISVLKDVFVKGEYPPNITKEH